MGQSIRMITNLGIIPCSLKYLSKTIRVFHLKKLSMAIIVLIEEHLKEIITRDSNLFYQKNDHQYIGI